MIRVFFREIIFFFVPFLLYFGYLIIRRRHPARWDNWSAHVSWLSLVGMVCVILSMLVAGLIAPRDKRAWIPPHMENNVLVPGRFE